MAGVSAVDSKSLPDFLSEPQVSQLLLAVFGPDFHWISARLTVFCANYSL
jgi:hypothetical protein